MRRMHHLRNAALIIVMLALSPLLAAEQQGWINNSLTLSVNRAVSLKFSSEIRHYEIAFADAYLHSWQGGVVWNLSARTYAGIFYKREATAREGDFLQENRFTLEGGWKWPLTKTTRFDLRLRMEIRAYGHDQAENHLRFRLRLRLATRVNLGAIRLKPFLAMEPFADTLTHGVYRHRFYLGAAIPLSAHVEWVTNYIRQDSRGKEPLHILNTGLEMKF